MSLISILAKQFIGVIQWNEPQDGKLAFRFPMRELEIQSDGQLTVSESQMAAFVQDGRIADIFGPGLYLLNARNLPLLGGLLNWDRNRDLPFKSEVYFFSTRLQIDQKWGTEAPILLRDRDFGAVRLRCFGNYSYRITDPRLFFNQISSTRSVYFASDLEGQLRDTLVAHLAGVFSKSGLPLLDLASNQPLLGVEIGVQLKPVFAALGLELIQVTVEHIALPEEVAKVLDQRILHERNQPQRNGSGSVSDLNRYAQFAGDEANVPVSDSAAFTHAARGTGAAVGSGIASDASQSAAFGPASAIKSSAFAVATEAAPGLKFCAACGESIPERARFCCDCGTGQ